MDALNNPENIKILGNILKTNVSACSSIGSPFIIQIARIYNEMLNLYKIDSQLISQSVATQGMNAFHSSLEQEYVPNRIHVST